MGIMVYSLFFIMGNAEFIYHQSYTLNPIDPLKEPLKGTLIDPFKGTLGFISSTVAPWARKCRHHS